MISLIALPFLAGEAQACTCIEYGTPACAAYWRADAVFAGYVADIRKLPDSSVNDLHQVLLHFNIEESYRGIADSEVDVATLSGTSCDIVFAKGEKWLVYAYRNKANNRLEIHPCTRTRRLEYANDDLEYIRGLKQKAPEQSVLGKVLQNSYSPLSGVKVTVEGGGNKLETNTDNEGVYQIALPQPGLYTVRAFVPFAAAVTTYTPEERMELRLTDEQTVIEYALNIPERQCDYRQLDVLKIDLHATAEIGGRVLTDSGQPVTFGYIHLVNAEDASDRDYKKIEANGSFKFEGVAVGRYFLVINPDAGPPGENDAPYARTFYPGVSNSERATPISVAEGAKLENIDFRVRAPLRERVITGKVVWADGRPAKKASVSLYDGAANRYIRMIVTDDNGNFKMKLYGDFKYEIEARVYAGISWRGERIKVPTNGKPKPFRLVVKPE